MFCTIYTDMRIDSGAIPSRSVVSHPLKTGCSTTVVEAVAKLLETLWSDDFQGAKKRLNCGITQFERQSYELCNSYPEKLDACYELAAFYG